MVWLKNFFPFSFIEIARVRCEIEVHELLRVFFGDLNIAGAMLQSIQAAFHLDTKCHILNKYGEWSHLFFDGWMKTAAWCLWIFNGFRLFHMHTHKNRSKLIMQTVWTMASKHNGIMASLKCGHKSDNSRKKWQKVQDFLFVCVFFENWNVYYHARAQTHKNTHSKMH